MKASGVSQAIIGCGITLLCAGCAAFPDDQGVFSLGDPDGKNFQVLDSVDTNGGKADLRRRFGTNDYDVRLRNYVNSVTSLTFNVTPHVVFRTILNGTYVAVFMGGAPDCATRYIVFSSTDHETSQTNIGNCLSKYDFSIAPDGTGLVATEAKLGQHDYWIYRNPVGNIATVEGPLFSPQQMTAPAREEGSFQSAPIKAVGSATETLHGHSAATPSPGPPAKRPSAIAKLKLIQKAVIEQPSTPKTQKKKPRRHVQIKLD